RLQTHKGQLPAPAAQVQDEPHRLRPCLKVRLKSLIHTNIHAEFRRVFAHVQTSRLIDQLFFGLGNPLAQKQVLGPGWHHDLDMEVIGLGRVGKQLPAVSSISQINQPQLIDKSVELGSSSLVQLNVDCNKHRPVLRSWNVDEIRRQRSDGPRLNIEPFGKIN